MSTIEKLIKKMLTIPKDFKESDCDRIMAHFNYRKYKARDGGSGMKYIHESGTLVDFHSPHKPDGEHNIKTYIIQKMIKELKDRGYIK